jgi:hypothetical protein
LLILSSFKDKNNLEYSQENLNGPQKESILILINTRNCYKCLEDLIGFIYENGYDKKYTINCIFDCKTTFELKQQIQYFSSVQYFKSIKNYYFDNNLDSNNIFIKHKIDISPQILLHKNQQNILLNYQTLFNKLNYLKIKKYLK